MTALVTAAPSYCARFGVAVLLAALADFLFYGQPAGTHVSDVIDVDTPYNTYMHTGLPPTPIANPGRASIEAALAPSPPLGVGDPLCADLAAGVKCELIYYVVSDVDGHHVFAVTPEQHEANVQAAREAGLLDR